MLFTQKSIDFSCLPFELWPLGCHRPAAPSIPAQPASSSRDLFAFKENEQICNSNSIMLNLNLNARNVIVIVPILSHIVVVDVLAVVVVVVVVVDDVDVRACQS